MVVTFHNHGPGAGTSLAHLHSQLVAIPVVPRDMRHNSDVTMPHLDDLGTCLYPDIMGRELGDGPGVILETPRLVAFQPFAAAAPFETWIVPRFHQAADGAPPFDPAGASELRLAARSLAP